MRQLQSELHNKWHIFQGVLSHTAHVQKSVKTTLGQSLFNSMPAVRFE